MSFTYRFHPSAQEEYESSVSWYLERNLKAATDFVNAVENGIAKTCKNPYLHRNIYKNYHEFNIQKYPFTIVYTIEDPSQMIIVIAVHHHKREPNKKYR